MSVFGVFVLMISICNGTRIGIHTLVVVVRFLLKKFLHVALSSGKCVIFFCEFLFRCGLPGAHPSEPLGPCTFLLSRFLLGNCSLSGVSSVSFSSRTIEIHIKPSTLKY